MLHASREASRAGFVIWGFYCGAGWRAWCPRTSTSSWTRTAAAAAGSACRSRCGVRCPQPACPCCSHAHSQVGHRFAAEMHPPSGSHDAVASQNIAVWYPLAAKGVGSARAVIFLNACTKSDGCLFWQDAAVRGAVKTVQVKGPNTNWETMNNVWGASWELSQSPQPPLDVRILDDQGTEVPSLDQSKEPLLSAHAAVKRQPCWTTVSLPVKEWAAVPPWPNDVAHLVCWACDVAWLSRPLQAGACMCLQRQQRDV